ncbi:aldo/keto reductase [Nocardioides sp. CN2-186]|uniref:aldo/keto reductase n=1 Tax=Nocardioides tweenelious TaxID=3156607 RepID=UPI0032B499C2
MPRSTRSYVASLGQPITTPPSRAGGSSLLLRDRGHQGRRPHGAYRALETLLGDGKVRAIGVSNFMVDHLTRLAEVATVVPAVSQIEVHPYFQQPAEQAYGAEHGILTQAWAPIGGITFYRDSGHTSTLEVR